MTDNERLRKWLDAAVELAYRAGAEQERAAVVAWLRNEWEQGSGMFVEAARRAIDCIERGEQRREREPLEDDSIEYRDIGKEE